MLRSATHGRFEVRLDGRLVFDKEQAGRFPEPGELTRLLEPGLGPPPPWRG